LKSCDLKRRFEYHLSPCALKIHKCENDGWAAGYERAITANQHAFLIARAKYANCKINPSAGVRLGGGFAQVGVE